MHTSNRQTSLHISAEEVPSYFYRDRTDLKEVILEDSVREIGEGAFFRCTSLEKITVGRGVCRVRPRAFDQIAGNADIVWLAQTSYKSMLMRILPSFSELLAICAPGAVFEKTREPEKRVLAAGYLFHPEYAGLYRPEEKECYVRYLRENLPSMAAVLGEKGVIHEALEKLWMSDLLDRQDLQDRDRRLLRQLLSYARSRKTDAAQKKLLDRIGQETGLDQEQENVFSEDYRKDSRILRRIREMAEDTDLLTVLEAADFGRLPELPCRKEAQAGDAASKGEMLPAEVLKYILYSYLRQVSPQSPLTEFHRVGEADLLAERIEPEAWQAFLKKNGPVLRREGPGKYTVCWPQRMIPVLRFAGEDLVREYAGKRETWADYDSCGASGYLAGEILSRAMLLNPGEEAMLFAAKEGLLEPYVRLHGGTEESCFRKALLLLTGTGRPEMTQLLERVRGRVYDAWITGRSISCTELVRMRLRIPELAGLLSGLLWSDGKSFFTPEEPEGEEEPAGTSLICLAHPAEMDIIAIRARLREDSRRPFFLQIYEPGILPDPENFPAWKDRYRDLTVKRETLTRLTDGIPVYAGMRMQVTGDSRKQVKISFGGKPVLDAEAEKDGRLRLGELQERRYERRELYEIFRILDDAFCKELLLAGKRKASGCLDRLDTPEVQEILQASIEGGYAENIPVLIACLQERKKMSENGESGDPELDW